MASKRIVMPMMQVCRFATYKSSTGLVGLAVDGNPRKTLLSLSQTGLQNVKKIPETSLYRSNVERWLNFVVKTVNSTEDIKAIEDEIDMGQVEEVAKIIRNEISLIDSYYENKGWELCAEAQRKADEAVAEMADSIFFSTPEKPPAPPAAPAAK